ncbi:MAG: dihydroorotate dehydrogenase [Anaerolineae bacterium]|nr:dihydroorotate dehydrogenase [Anaerolineae bacterium]
MSGGGPDLSVALCGIRLPSPLVLASGIWGSCPETLVRVARAGAGAVTAKSCSLEPRRGHANPTVLAWEAGLINAVGLTNPGAAQQREWLRRAKAGLQPLGVALIASVFGESRQAFREATQIVAEAEPDLIELNISCPNVESEFGRPFALEPDAAAGVVVAVRSVYGGPLLVKLSPNAPEIVGVARAVEDAGADGLTAVNTLGPGMLIDVYARRPILSNRVGGISGAALRPIAVRCVYEIAQAVRIPIIGTGGLSTGEHVLQMIMAGATAVGLGSAMCGEGEQAFSRILHEIEAFMLAENCARLADLRGCAHV